MVLPFDNQTQVEVSVVDYAASTKNKIVSAERRTTTVSVEGSNSFHHPTQCSILVTTALGGIESVTSVFNDDSKETTNPRRRPVSLCRNRSPSEAPTTSERRQRGRRKQKQLQYPLEGRDDVEKDEDFSEQQTEDFKPQQQPLVKMIRETRRLGFRSAKPTLVVSRHSQNSKDLRC